MWDVANKVFSLCVWTIPIPKPPHPVLWRCFVFYLPLFTSAFTLSSGTSEKDTNKQVQCQSKHFFFFLLLSFPLQQRSYWSFSSACVQPVQTNSSTPTHRHKQERHLCTHPWIPATPPTPAGIRKAGLFASARLAFGRLSIFGWRPSHEPNSLSSPPYLIYLRITSGV